ncbi:hypothetical protein ACJJTC_003979 [Scirpophaga incertulas]
MSVATLDEAMLLTGFGKYNLQHMLMCGMILMGMIMQSLALGYVMPAAQCDLNLTMKQRGWLGAIPFFAMILTSYFWGYLADTRGRRPVMLVTMILSILFSLLNSFSPNLIVFAILSFISSVFMSGPSAVVYTYLGEFNSLKHRDKMIAFGSSFIAIGTIVLPIMAWIILPMTFNIPLGFISYRPWRLLVVACALPYAVAATLLSLAPESPKFLNAVGRQDECLEVVKKIYKTNGRDNETFPVKSLVVERQGEKQVSRRGLAAVLASLREQTVPLFQSPLLPWTCLACFVQFGILATTNGFYVWLPTILNSLLSNDGSDSRICDILSVQYNNSTLVEVCDDTIHTKTYQHSIYIGLVFLSMYIIVGAVVDFVGKKHILITVLLITGLCGICAHLMPNARLGVIMFAIFQMSGACIGLMNSVSVDLFPTKYRGMAVCLSMMMGRVGSMVGSNIIGLFLQKNCGSSFYVFGGTLVANGLSCLMLPSRKQSTISNINGTDDFNENPPISNSQTPTDPNRSVTNDVNAKVTSFAT